MSELEDKLNTILGDPQAMGQIMAPSPWAAGKNGISRKHRPHPNMGMSPPALTQNRPLHRTCPPCWVP